MSDNQQINNEAENTQESNPTTEAEPKPTEEVSNGIVADSVIVENIPHNTEAQKQTEQEPQIAEPKKRGRPRKVKEQAAEQDNSATFQQEKPQAVVFIDGATLLDVLVCDAVFDDPMTEAEKKLLQSTGYKVEIQGSTAFAVCALAIVGKRIGTKLAKSRAAKEAEKAAQAARQAQAVPPPVAPEPKPVAPQAAPVPQQDAAAVQAHPVTTLPSHIATESFKVL